MLFQPPCVVNHLRFQAMHKITFPNRMGLQLSLCLNKREKQMCVNKYTPFICMPQLFDL